jgi:uroporphyrinogen decarboxylase
VLCALGHEEPDRVPLFIGTSGATTVLGPGYEKLRTHLGIRGGPTRWLSRPLQYTWMDEEVLVRLGSDGRPLAPGPAGSALRKDVSDDCLIDDWGVTWQRRPGSLYFEVSDPPLRNATLDDLEQYPWPDLLAPSRFVGLADRANAIQEAGYAAVLLSGVTLFEQAYLMRGIDALLTDLAGDEEFFTALLVKIKSLALPYIGELLRHVGPYIDVLVTGDDLGMSEGPMMSPKSYRRLIKPHQADVLRAIKRGTTGKVFFHSCGNVFALLGDLVDIGVDLLNPVQVSAGAMGDTARLKREFGDRLSFCGAIDTRWVLPHGTTAEVRQEVRRRIRDLAPGGGYVAAAVHCLQPDVPPENIVAMCDEVAAAGRYPLHTA